MGRTASARRPVTRRTQSPAGRARFAAGAVLLVLVVGVYLNALDNPFIYDDFYTVAGNPSIARTADLRWAVVYMPFRPITNLSYALDRAVWGYRPFGYHLTSVALHAGVCLLLFTFLLRILQDTRPAWANGNDRRPGRETWAAFAGAAIFAVHPIQSETAGYISSRPEILCGLFILAALLFARAAQVVPAGGGGPATRSRRGLAATGAVASAVLAMLSKEVGASLPVLLVACDWLVLPGTASSRRRRLALVFVPLGVLTALVVLHRVRSLSGTDAALAAAPGLNVLTQSIVIWRYLAMMVVPAGQSIVHQTHAVTSMWDPAGLAAAAGLVALAAGAFALRRASPLYALGAVWWFACIAPSSSLIALRETMAEHRVYVASAGVAIVVAAVSSRLLERGARGGAARVPVGFRTGLAAILVVLGTLTVMRNAVWGRPADVWREALAASPSAWDARYALADALREEGDCAAAIGEYEAALRVQPDSPGGLTNYGICLGELRRLPEAEAAFRRVLAIDPAYARSYTNLAAVALLEGDEARAREYYHQAILVDPRTVQARVQLARIYETRLRDYARAAQLCEEALAIAPSRAGLQACVERNRRLARSGDGGGPR